MDSPIAVLDGSFIFLDVNSLWYIAPSLLGFPLAVHALKCIFPSMKRASLHWFFPYIVPMLHWVFPTWISHWCHPSQGARGPYSPNWLPTTSVHYGYSPGVHTAEWDCCARAQQLIFALHLSSGHLACYKFPLFTLAIKIHFLLPPYCTCIEIVHPTWSPGMLLINCTFWLGYCTVWLLYCWTYRYSGYIMHAILN